MVVVFILELAAGITGYVMRGKAQEMLQNQMKSSLKNYTSDENVYSNWDKIQSMVSKKINK